MTADFQLYWVLVPVVASVIGYSTNWIAIKMLFRPLQEKRVFGFRVPFTPGLVPRRKNKIAENIGEAVAKHLVTSEGIQGRLDTPEVKSGLKITVRNWLESELDKDRGRIEDLVPAEYQPRLDEVQSGLAEKLTGWTVEFLRSSALDQVVERGLSSARAWSRGKELGVFLSPDTADLLAANLEELIFDFAEGKEFERGVQYFWIKKLREFDRHEGKISSLFSERFLDFVTLGARNWVPSLLQQGVIALDNPEFRGRAKEFLRDFISEKVREGYDEDSVWDQVKYGFVEIFVVGNEDLDTRIDEAVDDGFPRIIELLEQEEVRREIADYGVKTLKNLLDRDLSDLGISNEREKEIASLLTVVSVELIRNERVRSAVDRILRGLLEELKGRDLDEIIGSFDEETDLSRKVSRAVHRLAETGDFRSQVNNLINAQIGSLRSRRLGKLSRWVDAEDLDPFIEMLIESSTGSISTEISELLSVIDVRNLVKKEVNNFSTLEVEGLVLDVTGNQLRAITWFGAVLGFLIGVIQLAVVVLGG
ncbi:MAG: DUF445 family protein [Candidatus Acetothermia bacterium]